MPVNNWQLAPEEGGQKRDNLAPNTNSPLRACNTHETGGPATVSK